jgi:hypothetical protein
MTGFLAVGSSTGSTILPHMPTRPRDVLGVPGTPDVAEVRMPYWRRRTWTRSSPSLPITVSSEGRFIDSHPRGACAKPTSLVWVFGNITEKGLPARLRREPTRGRLAEQDPACHSRPPRALACARGSARSSGQHPVKCRRATRIERRRFWPTSAPSDGEEGQKGDSAPIAL